MRQIALTVLFATRNGEKVLSRTLNAYRRIKQSDVSWKLVIVDNGSSDSTLEIIKSFQKDLPIEVYFEPIAGKNRALNRGLDAVEGQLVVLTDDDTFPSPSFLQAWARFIDTKSDYGLFGGSIIPIFETAPQSWLTADQHLCSIVFGARDLPEGPVDPQEIFGGNMAVRRSVFDNGFRFNENVGPSGFNPNYPMGSETEFCLRVASAGISCWFAKEPVVEHFVRSFQMTDSYLADRSYRCGRGEGYRLKKGEGKLHEGGPRAFIIGQIAALRRRVLLHHRLEMFSPFPLQRRRAIHRYHFKRGILDELNV
jgi:glycosyltransferase involved in cell wall biosynthesis